MGAIRPPTRERQLLGTSRFHSIGDPAGDAYEADAPVPTAVMAVDLERHDGVARRSVKRGPGADAEHEALTVEGEPDRHDEGKRADVDGDTSRAAPGEELETLGPVEYLQAGAVEFL